MTRKSLGLLAILVSAAVTLTAGPPYTTDDPETPRRRGWEINIPLIIARSSSLSQAQVPLFDLNYGLFDNFQLDLEVPVYRLREPGQASVTGLGDVMVGIKWRFLEETKNRPQIAVYPQICLPTGSAARGLGAGEPCYVLPVAVQKNWGKWTAYANAGYFVQKAAGSRDYLYYGAAITRKIADGLEIGIEAFANSAGLSGAGPVDGFNIGAELQVSRSIVLLGSVGHSFREDGDFLAYVGVQVLAGSNRRPRA